MNGGGGGGRGGLKGVGDERNELCILLVTCYCKRIV